MSKNKKLMKMIKKTYESYMYSIKTQEEVNKIKHFY